MIERRPGSRLGWRARVLAALLVAVQFAATGILPAVDARLEAQSSGVTAHAESTTTKACKPVHDHAVCPICRTLLPGALKDHASVAPSTLVLERRAVWLAPTPLAATAAFDAHPSRAPPAV